jgi:hypothetical protein
LEFLEEWGTENFEVCFLFFRVNVFMQFYLVSPYQPYGSVLV